MKNIIVGICLLMSTYAAAAIKTEHPRLLLTPERLTKIADKAAANDPSWIALKKYCDDNLSKTISGGYVGGDWAAAVEKYALAYHAIKTSNPTLAASYADKALAMMNALAHDRYAVGDGLGGLPPVASDSGFPIRNHGIYLALGYDWMYDYAGFTAEMKNDYVGMMQTWYVWYSTGGYQNDGPGIGNYFISFLEYLGAAGYATFGDNADAEVWISSATTLFNREVVSEAYPYIKGGYDPEGYGYGAGYISRLSRYLLYVQSATGENVHASYPWLDEAMTATLHFTKPDMRHCYDGGDWGGSSSGQTEYYFLEPLIEMYPTSAASNYAQYFLANVSTMTFAPSLLWGTTDVAAINYKDVFEPSYLADGMGTVFTRSSWLDGATFVAITGGGKYIADHQPKGYGHFTIDRNNTKLAINAAMFKDGSFSNNFKGAGATSPLSDVQTQFLNCHLIDDKSSLYGDKYMEYAPSQMIWTSTDNCRVNAYENKDAYTYMDSILYGAYGTKPSGTNRHPHKYYNREFFYVRPDIVIVYDKLDKQKDYFETTYRVNYATEPVISGNITKVDYQGQRLFSSVVLPLDYTISKSTSVARAPDYLWRVDVKKPTTTVTTETYLNVHYPCDQTVETMPVTEAVTTTDGAMQGTVIHSAPTCDATWAVLFSTSATRISHAIFSIDGEGDVKVALCDMKPDTYFNVFRDGTEIATIHSSTAGVASFDTTLGSEHTFEITEGEEPTLPTATLTASATSGTAPLTVSYTAVLNGATALTYSWTWSDGETSTEQNPTRTFNSSGIVTAVCRITYDGGDAVSDVLSVTISDPLPPSLPNVLEISGFEGSGFEIEVIN